MPVQYTEPRQSQPQTPQQRYDPPPKKPVKECKCDGTTSCQCGELPKGCECDGTASCKCDPSDRLTKEQVAEIVRGVIATNPITFIYQTLDESGEAVDSYIDKHGVTRGGQTDTVILGGTVRIPPQMLRIRQGDKNFIIGEALGSPMRQKIEGDLEVSGS